MTTSILRRRPTRRRFTAGYKAEILAEYDSWPKGSEERGAILRREGLYSSHISEWRKQAEAGARAGLAAKSKKRRSAEQIELDRLRRQNQRLSSELAKTQTALEITGKVHALWSSSPRARTPRPGRSRDRRASARPGGGHVDQAGV
ncbi:MAG: transposase [Acidimicrobiales bacterium]|nr:transposase [Acidimicrobiales bacterium]